MMYPTTSTRSFPRRAPLLGIVLCVTIGWVVAAAFGGDTRESEESSEPRRDLGEFLGVTHVAGSYHLTERDFLNEGADQILELGVKTIKLYLARPSKDYPFGTEWPDFKSLVEIARTEPFRTVFEKPFRTYILTTYSPRRPHHYWRKGVSGEEAAAEEREIRELVTYLLSTYDGSGKTFVLQHWEGDWAIRGSFDRKTPLDPVAVRGMTDWLNARQRGVDAARKEKSWRDVHVYHATEVNLVVQSMQEGIPGVADAVVPATNVDLVSYSAWDSQEDPELLRKALDFIASHLPPRETPFRRRVYVGEFGAPENDFSPDRVEKTIQGTFEVARTWGCPWAVYWQVYCNEPRTRPVTSNQDVRGFHLIRPDGSRSLAWRCLLRRCLLRELPSRTR